MSAASRRFGTGGRPSHFCLIVSPGRTGTMFFGETLSRVFEDAHSVHEPDTLHVLPDQTLREKAKEAWTKIATLGPYQAVIGKLLGRTGVRCVMQRHLAGRADREWCVAALHESRRRLFRHVDARYYIESCCYWYGLLDVVPELFDAYKVVAIVRDPRTWVQSRMNFGGHYDAGDVVMGIGLDRINPIALGDTEHAARWPSMSAFEKNCWVWQLCYRLVVEAAVRDENVRIYRFEDLFDAEGGGDAMADLLAFMSHFEDRDFSFDPAAPALRERVNASSPRALVPWRQWEPARAQALQGICGGLMERFGYGREPEWQALLSPSLV